MAATVLVVAARPVLAQAGTPLQPGDRVRVSRPGPTIGTLTAVESGMIVVQRADGVTVSIARTASTRLAMSDGPGPCDNRARVVCVVGGAFAGGLLAFGTMSALESPASDLPSPATYLSGPIGALVGGFVGAKVGGERWRVVPLPLHVSVPHETPGTGTSWRGASLRLRVTF